MTIDLNSSVCRAASELGHRFGKNIIRVVLGLLTMHPSNEKVYKNPIGALSMQSQ